MFNVAQIDVFLSRRLNIYVVKCHYLTCTREQHADDDAVRRIGGPIFFANADKFVDELYGAVLRPTTDVKQSLAACDDRHQRDAEKQATTTNDVEMKELRRATGGAAIGPTTTTTTNADKAAVEALDLNDNAEEHAAVAAAAAAGVTVQLHDDHIRAVVLDFSRVTFVDSTAVAALRKVYTAYRQLGVRVVFGGCDAAVTAVMAAARLSQGRVEFYPTVHDAVIAVC